MFGELIFLSFSPCTAFYVCGLTNQNSLSRAGVPRSSLRGAAGGVQGGCRACPLSLFLSPFSLSRDSLSPSHTPLLFSPSLSSFGFPDLFDAARDRDLDLAAESLVNLYFLSLSPCAGFYVCRLRNQNSLSRAGVPSSSLRGAAGGVQGGGRACPLSLSLSPATPSRPRIFPLFLSLPLLSLVSLDLFNAARS